MDVMRQRADRLAHDFNNLLTTMLGYANLLSRSLDEGDPRRADADEIVAVAQRASALVRQLARLGRDEEANDPAAGSAGDPSATPRSSARGTILVVDDERTVRYLVRTILTRAGYEVGEAATAEGAERWLASHAGSLDLLISDIALPDGSGPNLAGRLCRRQPSLKVLFISGYNDDQIRRDARITPDTPFIQKPFTAETLTEQVQLALFPPGR